MESRGIRFSQETCRGGSMLVARAPLQCCLKWHGLAAHLQTPAVDKLPARPAAQRLHKLPPLRTAHHTRRCRAVDKLQLLCRHIPGRACARHARCWQLGQCGMCSQPGAVGQVPKVCALSPGIKPSCWKPHQLRGRRCSQYVLLPASQREAALGTPPHSPVPPHMLRPRGDNRSFLLEQDNMQIMWDGTEGRP